MWGSFACVCCERLEQRLLLCRHTGLLAECTGLWGSFENVYRALLRICGAFFVCVPYQRLLQRRLLRGYKGSFEKEFRALLRMFSGLF